MHEHSDKRKPGPPPSEPIQVEEQGLGPGGTKTSMDRRLFMQLLVFDLADDAVPGDYEERLRAIHGVGMGHVVYADINAPRGYGLLSWSEDPADFVLKLRPQLQALPALRPRAGWAMLGRTYAVGYERDLVHWLIDRPQANAKKHPWAVFYPLRRKGGFNLLDSKEKRRMLGEHAGIGRAFGTQGHATDIRLTCTGLDAEDNDFVIGLLGDRLHRLSLVVEHMRGTQQTGAWIEKMGPFFVGRSLD